MNLPTGKQAALEWFEARQTTWQTNATSIGLTAIQMTAFKALVSTNRADFNTMQTARAAAKAATQTFYNSFTLMRDPGRGYIAAIKAFAETTRNNNVYALGMIDPPAPPSPVPAPTVPTDLTGAVSPTGEITISWKALTSGPSSGIFFMVQRQRAGETSYTLMGGKQEKSFLDPSPHVADGPVSYQVRAQRGTDQSNWTVPIVFDLAGGQGGAGFASFTTGSGAESTVGFIGGNDANAAKAA